MMIEELEQRIKRQQETVTRALVVLKLIAEKYPAEGLKDPYIRLRNPEYQPDNGTDPFIVLDVRKFTKIFEEKEW